MSSKKLRRIAVLLWSMMLVISFYGCGDSTNKAPCEKGPGYWVADGGVLWFYSEGNNENYWKATGEIVVGDERVPINIQWTYSRSITVCNVDGTELFVGRTYMNKQNLADGKCKIIIEKWLVDELFPERELIAVWCGQELPQ